jgi:glycogen synthase
MIKRVFYAAAGPANLVSSHEHWVAGTHNPTEVSMTFSGQIQDYCREIGAEGYFVSVHPDVKTVRDSGFVNEHRPKRPRSGWRFHVEELRYGFGLLKTARDFGADVAVLDSGATSYHAMALFRLFGIPVVPVLYNSLWPSGFPPTKLSARLVGWLDALYLTWLPKAIFAISPECERQVDTVAPGHRSKIYQVRAQFRRDYFAQIPPPPPHSKRPFQVMFIGRVAEMKGVLDIPDMASRIEQSDPGLVKWVICGTGPDFDELIQRVKDLDVGHAVEVVGWTSLEKLREVYATSHAAIVPTRSLFIEGLAMTAAEAILAGRPLISNPVVPALELLRPAAMAARTNDVESHADAVRTLALDANLYAKLCAACPALGEQFYDREMGLTAVLRRALSSVSE